jgi:hypothetical protein
MQMSPATFGFALDDPWLAVLLRAIVELDD